MLIFRLIYLKINVMCHTCIQSTNKQGMSRQQKIWKKPDNTFKKLTWELAISWKDELLYKVNKIKLLSEC